MDGVLLQVVKIFGSGGEACPVFWDGRDNRV